MPTTKRKASACNHIRQSTSSGRTGCFNGIIDFLSTSRDNAFLISENTVEEKTKRFH